MTVGERIKNRRVELGYSQEELAKKMGYSGKSTVCKAETCGDDITTTKIKKYASALNCSFEYLMGWEEIKTVNLDLSNPEQDGELLLMDETSKKYALKLYQLPDTKKKVVMDMIDQLYEGGKI